MNRSYSFDVVKIAEELERLDSYASDVVKLLVDNGLKIAFAESCTGGLLSERLTAVSGASSVFEAGFCTYSERIKTKALGVPECIIREYGVVSEETATSMAEGIRDFSSADITASVTGIAGPSGAEEGKPVGTVCVGFCLCGEIETYTLPFYKLDCIDRDIVRKLTVTAVFMRVKEFLSNLRG